MKKKVFFGLFLFFYLMGCMKDNKIEEVKIFSNEMISDKFCWCIVKTSHVRVKVDPDMDSETITTLWRGTLVEIEAKCVVLEADRKNRIFWYRIKTDREKGWIQEKNLYLYLTKREAMEALKKME